MKTSRSSFLIMSIAICFPFSSASAGEPNPDAFVNQEAKGIVAGTIVQARCQAVIALLNRIMKGERMMRC
jgi:hypothetical protein